MKRLMGRRRVMMRRRMRGLENEMAVAKWCARWYRVSVQDAQEMEFGLRERVGGCLITASREFGRTHRSN